MNLITNSALNRKESGIGTHPESNTEASDQRQANSKSSVTDECFTFGELSSSSSVVNNTAAPHPAGRRNSVNFGCTATVVENFKINFSKQNSV